MIVAIYIILILFIVIDFIRNREIFTPIKIFDFIWIVTLFLYELKLSYIQQDLSNRTLWIFIVCILSYNLASNIMYFFKIKKNQREVKHKISVDNKIKIANYIVIIIFIIEIIYSKGCPLFWKLTGSTKTYMDFGIASVHGALNGLVICLGAYTLFNKKCKYKYLYLLFGILTLSRQVLMSIVVEAIIFNIQDVIRKQNKINYKKYIILAIIVFLVFNLLGNFRSGKDVMDIVFRPRDGYENLSTATMWSYSYLTFSVSNFNNLVKLTDGAVNYGASSLSMLLPTAVLKFVHIQKNYSESYLVQSNFNASTYLPEIYLDFGIIGIAIFNIFIAILGTYIYKKAKATKSDVWLMLYAVFAHNIVFLFFVNMFLYLPIIVQFLYIPLIFSEKYKEMEEKNENKNNSNVFTSIP